MDRIGRVVGSYEIVERIGEGGMGTVYRALDPMLEREVAVKAIRPELLRDPQVALRFRAEAKLLARINHPAIATIYSFFEDGGELFLAMEFVRGKTLAAALKERGAFPWQEAVALLAAALPGIEQVHRLGIVHRDLKPDNLMLTESGGLKVMDFGIARAADAARLTRTGLMVGTLRYMAPEQLRGEAGDLRTDLYALGAVLYEMLTGRVPFASDSEYEVIRAQVEEAPAPPSSLAAGLPAWLDAAVLRALAKDPAERFQSAEEMRAVLAGAGRPASQATAPQRTAEIASLPTAVKPSAAAPPSPAPSSYRPVELSRPRRPGVWIGLAAALVAAVALALWALHARGGPAAPAGSPAAGGRASTALQGGEAPSAPGAAPSTGASSGQGPAEAVSAQRDAAPAEAVEPASAPAAAPVETAAPDAVAQMPAAAPIRPLARLRRALAAASGRDRSAPPASAGETAPAAPATSSPAGAPAVAASPPAPGVPEPASPSAPQSSPELMERLGELRATARDLHAAAGRLAEAYRRYVEPRRASGRPLTPAEDRLQVAVQDIFESSARFQYRLRPGAALPTPAPGSDRRAEVLAQARRMAMGSQQVERLIRIVQPGQDVEDAWQDVRRLTRQAVEILTR